MTLGGRYRRGWISALLSRGAAGRGRFSSKLRYDGDKRARCRNGRRDPHRGRRVRKFLRDMDERDDSARSGHRRPRHQHDEGMLRRPRRSSSASCTAGNGRVAKRLVGLVLDGESVPIARRRRSCRRRRDVGHVTSSVLSPALKRPIALAYVATRFRRARHGRSQSTDLAPVVTEVPFVPGRV